MTIDDPCVACDTISNLDKGRLIDFRDRVWTRACFVADNWTLKLDPTAHAVDHLEPVWDPQWRSPRVLLDVNWSEVQAGSPDPDGGVRCDILNGWRAPARESKS